MASTLNVTVMVTDKNSIAVPNQIISFVVASGGGSVFAGTAQTSAVGAAKEVWMLGKTAGDQILEARYVDQTTGTPVTIGSFTAAATPGRITKVLILLREAALFAKTTARVLDIGNTISAVDAYNNQVANPALTYAATGSAAISHDSVAVGTPGEALVVVTADTATASMKLHVLEDFRPSTWRLTESCANVADSIGIVLTSAAVTYLTPAINQAYAQTLQLAMSGMKTTWVSGSAPTSAAIVDTLRAAQQADTVSGFLLHGAGASLSSSASYVVTARGPTKYSAPTFCPSGYSSKRAATLEAIAP